MSSSPALPQKQDLPKEIWKITTALSDEAQNAAVRKARELGFDLSKGRIPLEETFINLSHNRDVILDAVEKNKLVLSMDIAHLDISAVPQKSPCRAQRNLFLHGIASYPVDALPFVAEKVAGRVPVFVDGGIRRGTDVLKALAVPSRSSGAASTRQGQRWLPGKGTSQIVHSTPGVSGA